MISRSIVVSSVVLFMTAAAFAQADMMGSGMMKGNKGSGMMGSGASGHQGAGDKGSGMMGSGMMEGMMGSGMMKKCRGMMASNKGAGDIQVLIDHRDELGLTDEQMTALKAIKSSLEKEIIKRKADLQVAEMEIEELLSSDEVRISSVESKLKQIQGLQAGIRLSRIKAKLQAGDLLSDEQQKMWDAEK